MPRSLERQPRRAVIQFDCGGFGYSFAMNLTESDCRKLVDLMVSEYGIRRAEPDYFADQDARDLVRSLERGLSYRE